MTGGAGADRLTPDLAALVEVAAAIGAGDPGQVDRALAVAATAAEHAEVEEVLLQSHLFSGYPAALDALAAWREIVPEAGAPRREEDVVSWAGRGEAVCRTVYGGQYDRLRGNVRRLHPEMEVWMVRDGYGRVLGRPGLSLVRRELCISAQLAAMGALRQLHSHLRGSLHAGATPGLIEAVLVTAVGPREGADAGSGAVWTTWDGVRSRHAARASGD